MQVLVVTPPAPIVDIGLAKTHVRVDGTHQDPVLQAYLDAAIEQVDGPTGYLGRAVGPQLIEVQFDSFMPDDLRYWYRLQPFKPPTLDGLNLPYGPLIKIVSVTYADAQNLDQLLTEGADFTLDPQGLLRDINSPWPATYPRRGAVRVRYWAGHVVDPAADPLVPKPPRAIVAAILLMVGDMFQNRETTDTGRVAQIPMSATVERLLAPWRVWTV